MVRGALSPHRWHRWKERGGGRAGQQKPRAAAQSRELLGQAARGGPPAGGARRLHGMVLPRCLLRVRARAGGSPREAGLRQQSGPSEPATVPFLSCHGHRDAKVTLPASMEPAFTLAACIQSPSDPTAAGTAP